MVDSKPGKALFSNRYRHCKIHAWHCGNAERVWVSTLWWLFIRSSGLYQLSYFFGKYLERKRLVQPRTAGLHRTFFPGVASYKQHLQARAQLAQQLSQPRTAHPRHHKIGDQDINPGGKCLRHDHGFAAVASHKHVISQPAEHIREHMTQQFLVLHQEDG